MGRSAKLTTVSRERSDGCNTAISSAESAPEACASRDRVGCSGVRSKLGRVRHNSGAQGVSLAETSRLQAIIITCRTIAINAKGTFYMQRSNPAITLKPKHTCTESVACGNIYLIYRNDPTPPSPGQNNKSNIHQWGGTSITNTLPYAIHCFSLVLA